MCKIGYSTTLIFKKTDVVCVKLTSVFKKINVVCVKLTLFLKKKNDVNLTHTTSILKQQMSRYRHNIDFLITDVSNNTLFTKMLSQYFWLTSLFLESILNGRCGIHILQ